jgi:predicted unusual protein kinase regulating ubiquinone biosynthesis (AarF/ABC1/UbiB family)
MTQERKLPEGRLGRLVRMAGVGARTGASLLLSKDSSGAAQQAAEVLGTLRGLAAKVGQMASYVDGIVPEGHREAYEGAMRSLRAAAPTSAPEAIRSVVEEDLGAPIDELFQVWEDKPFASASIGQVHRAVLPDGREVAVKVQHPGIARAVESDLENAGVLQGLVSTLGPRELNAKAVLDEVKARFREELDYTLEAERQARHDPRGRRDGAGGDPAGVRARALALRVQGEPRGRDVQCRPAPGQLSVPAGRDHHLPRFRVRAAHQRRAAGARARPAHGGVPARRG